jgi:S-adenosylmethionine synthetase
VAVAFVGAHVRDSEDYLAKKADIRDAAARVASDTLRTAASVEVNNADVPPDSLYLTVTGLSAESGDDGEAGRGNRANGLITPYRPMTMESLAGKNPVNHVGKLYNLAAALIADDLVRQIDEIEGAEVYLVSQIGHPIDEPQIIDVRLQPAGNAPIPPLLPRITAIVTANLSQLHSVADDLLNGNLGFDRWPLRLPSDGCTGRDR